MDRAWYYLAIFLFIILILLVVQARSGWTPLDVFGGGSDERIKVGEHCYYDGKDLVCP